MVNYNPTVVLTDAGQEANRPNYLQRGTQIIYTAARYHLTLKDELMHPDVFHLKQKPSKNRTLLTKFLPNTRISIKSKVVRIRKHEIGSMKLDFLGNKVLRPEKA